MSSKAAVLAAAGLVLMTGLVPGVSAHHTGKEEPLPRGELFSHTICVPVFTALLNVTTVCGTGEVRHSEPSCARTLADGYHCDVTLQYHISWTAAPLPALVYVNGTTNVTDHAEHRPGGPDIRGSSASNPSEHTYTGIPPEKGKTVNVTAWICVAQGRAEAPLYQECERWVTGPIVLDGENDATAGVPAVLGLVELAVEVVDHVRGSPLLPVSLHPHTDGLIGTDLPEEESEQG